MSDGGYFALGTFAVVVLGLWGLFLWTRYQAGPGEEKRQRTMAEEFGPGFGAQPSAPYVDHHPITNEVDNPHGRWSYRGAMDEPDWEVMEREAGR